MTRPVVPLENPDAAAHRRQLASRVNAALPNDGTGEMIAPLTLKSYTVATLPTASDWEAAIIFVSDEAGGAIPAFSDGVSWRRVSDRAVVS